MNSPAGQPPVSHPPKLNRGDQVAVLSPSLAGPAFGPQVHEQALHRLRTTIGVQPVEYPTTRVNGCSPEARAEDINAAFADPKIAAILATVGGWSLIDVLPYLDMELIASHPKIFVGHSDNTHINNYLFHCGISSFYGSSTMIHIGSGPGIARLHEESLRRVLFHGGSVRLGLPGWVADHGFDFADPRALTDHGPRVAFPDPVWGGASNTVTGHSWGGCIEVIDSLIHMSLIPSPEQLHGAILLLETSNPRLTTQELSHFIAQLGNCGVLQAAAGVLWALSPTTDVDFDLPLAQRAHLWRQRAHTVISQVGKFNPDIPICCGYPFGHTQPQIIMPHYGQITMVPNPNSPTGGEVWAQYD